MSRVPPQVRAVFFDAVGTLLFPDPPAPVIYTDIARQHGLTLSPAEVRERFITAFRAEEEADAVTGWATSEPRERDRWHRIVTHTLAGVRDPEACFRFLFEHFAKPIAWRLSPDASDTVTTLDRRGLLLGIGSNYDERLWPVLGGFPELAIPRDRVVISAAVGVRKPGAEFFQHAAQSAGCEVSEVLFVGDDLENDFVGATTVGMPALLLDPHNRHPDVAQRITRLAELAE